MKRRRLALVVVLGLAGLLLPLAGPAPASHGALKLEVTPDVESALISTDVDLTATLRDANTGQTVNAPGPIKIDFEIESGPTNPDGNTRQTPDRNCTIGTGTSSCMPAASFNSSLNGTNIIRAWIDHDGVDEDQGGTTEADTSEGRFSGVTDCPLDDPNVDSCPIPGDQGTPGGTAERDITDVVSITWNAGPDRIDCDDANGNDSDTNPQSPAPAPLSANETYTCTVIDENGNVVSGVRIDGENRNGANDPDDNDGGTADHNDFCTSGANGMCTGTISGAEGQTGSALICFWADPDNDNVYSLAGSEDDGGKCDEEDYSSTTDATDAPENNNMTEVVRKSWRVLANQQFIPEGATHSGFTTFLLLANPTAADAIVNVTFFTPTGPFEPLSVQELEVEAGKRFTINVNQTLGQQTDVASRVVAFNNSVVAEISMHKAGSLATMDMAAASATSALWEIPEGATHSGYATFVTIVNPNTTTDSHVDIDFLKPTGRVAGPRGLLVAKGARVTVNAGVACNCQDDVSTEVKVVGSEPPVVAGMSLHRLSGDLAIGGSLGVSATKTNWVVAEGVTHSGFATFVLITNPGITAASVDVDFLTPSGLIDGGNINVPMGSRQTISVNSRCGCVADVSTLLVSNQPIAVESSVQKEDASGFVIADSIGSGGTSISDASGTQWLAAEGATHSGFTTFVLIANPSNSAATVNVVFLTPGGTINGPQALAVPAQGRVTINVNTACGCLADASTLVTATLGKVVVEMSIDRATGAGFSKGRSLAFRLLA